MPLRMEVTPQVTTDSSIIMQLDVERTFKGDIVGTGDDEKFSVNKRKINTKVLVRNGQTAVIGGIYKSDSSSGQTGVPFFRSLPFVGVLFRSEVESNDKSELIIFLTPRIVGQALSKSEGAPAAGSF
jgi:type IV pilus assembly protein PilQ